MAQRNPVTTTGSLSTTGSSNAPVSTNSAYGTGTGTVDTRSTGQKIKDAISGDHSSGTTTNTSTTSTSTSTHPSGTQQKVDDAGRGIGGVLAGVHGIGEKIRGEFNAGVDRAFDEPGTERRNQEIAEAGDVERKTGRFTEGTKEREGGGGRRI